MIEIMNTQPFGFLGLRVIHLIMIAILAVIIATGANDEERI